MIGGSRRRLVTAVSVALAAGALVTSGCSGDGVERVRYDAGQMIQGVNAELRPEGGPFESATVFMVVPENISQLGGYDGELEEPVVLRPDGGDYDVVVVYLAGPYCGFAPIVEAKQRDSTIDVAVASIQDGDCDTLQYTEAVGLVFAPGVDPDTKVIAEHRNR